MGPLIINVINIRKGYKNVFGIIGLLIGGWLATLNTAPVDLHFAFVRNPFITYVTAVVLFMSIAWLLSIFRSRMLSYVGRNTLLLLGMQIGTPYIAILIQKFSVVIGLGDYYPIGVAASLSVVFMVSAVYLCKVIEKNLPWIYTAIQPSVDSR